MIYQTNLYKKEIRQKKPSINSSFNQMVCYGIFLGLITFAIHFMLQTVSESIMTLRFPELMLPSYHTVLYTYTLVSYIFFFVYFILGYKKYSFYDLYTNRWYLYQNFGYSKISSITSKLSGILIRVTVIYTIGYLTSFLLTVFLNYTLILDYLIPIYIVGATNLLLMISFFLCGSLLITKSETPNYWYTIVIIVIYIMQLTTNYYDLVKNRVLLQDIRNLFDASQTVYFLIAIPLVLLLFLFCFFCGYRLIGHYQEPYHIRKPRRIFHILTDRSLSVLSTIFISICMMVQLLILTVSFVSPEREITIQGMIPYVFQSTTMEPEIYRNDLVYFEKIDVQAELSVGDIILFNEEDTVYVEKIISLGEDFVTVNITNYPVDSKEGIMIKSINRSTIYGKYRGHNRWLGALILFANTIFGRILFLILPAILIFFHQPIFEQIKKVQEKDGTSL